MIMKLTENLTKENFFNEMMTAYPLSMKLFCDWIDEYKKEVGWDKLFESHYRKGNVKRASNGEIYHIDWFAPKFHDIPYAMQQGIWIEFVGQTLHKYFEQPEYEYCLDLEEDIKTVFGEIEPLIEQPTD